MATVYRNLNKNRYVLPYSSDGRMPLQQGLFISIMLVPYHFVCITFYLVQSKKNANSLLWLSDQEKRFGQYERNKALCRFPLLQTLATAHWIIANAHFWKMTHIFYRCFRPSCLQGHCLPQWRFHMECI